jgi:hypothetical protein
VAFTSQITVNASGDTAIVCNDACKIVILSEDPGVASWPTTDFLVKKGGSSQYIRVPRGQTYTFQSGPSFFSAGQTIGFLKTVSGTTTFDQDEDQA